MACYDCEDCNLNKQFGGKCDRFEYDCPFSHLPRLNDYNAEIKQKEFEAAKLLLNDLKDVYGKYRHEIVDYSEEYGMDSIERVISDIEDLVDPDIVKEWRRIIGEEKE